MTGSLSRRTLVSGVGGVAGLTAGRLGTRRVWQGRVRGP